MTTKDFMTTIEPNHCMDKLIVAGLKVTRISYDPKSQIKSRVKNGAKYSFPQMNKSIKCSSKTRLSRSDSIETLPLSLTNPSFQPWSRGYDC